MLKINHILGVFFLVVYSMVLLHNLVPHQHDETKCPNLHAAGCAHHSDHSHHHAHSGFMSVLLNWLDDFNHTGLCVGHYENYLLAELKPEVKLPPTIYIFPIDLREELFDFTLKVSLSEPRSLDIPPNLYSSLFIASTDSRGPPAIC